MNRAVDLTQGIAYVVTDLHGEWSPYVCYRDHFLDLHQQGKANILLFLGDVIHGYGPEEADYSLAIVLDIMQLQAELGPQSVIMLLGNHELPHIYSITLAKGDISLTPRFEHRLGNHRSEVIEFLKGLPFVARTAGGTMLMHSGATESAATPESAQFLLSFSHQALLDEVTALLTRHDTASVLQTYLRIDAQEYDRLARHYLAVSGPDDPRYLDLLRGLIITHLNEWPLVWDFFFNRCEMQLTPTAYRAILTRFLEVFSTPQMPQRVLVTGHIPVQGGFEIVMEQHLRIASWAHATPKEAGCYLLFDVARPVERAADLLPFVYRIPL